MAWLFLRLSFYMMLLWPWINGMSEEMRTASEPQGEWQTSGRQMLVWVTTVLVVFGLPLLAWHGVSWRARLAGCLSVLVWSWLFLKGILTLGEKIYGQKKKDSQDPGDT